MAKNGQRPKRSKSARSRLGWALGLGFVLAACASNPAPIQTVNVVRQVSVPPSVATPLEPPPVEPDQFDVSQREPVTVSPLAQQGPFQPNLHLFTCFARTRNAPATDAQWRVRDFRPLVNVLGVVLATVPVNDACMSSGFGPRFGRQHEGIDLQSEYDAEIYSAGPGIVREVETARGYGKYVLIDHGRGVFTRYAHLNRFGAGIVPGIEIGFGQHIGDMGNSGNATAIHLHYEVLTGDYNTPQRSFGLRSTNPLEWPEHSLDDVRAYSP